MRSWAATRSPRTDHTSLPLTEITYGGSATINITASDGTLTSSNYVSGRTGDSIGPNGLEGAKATPTFGA